MDIKNVVFFCGYRNRGLLLGLTGEPIQQRQQEYQQEQEQEDKQKQDQDQQEDQWGLPSRPSTRPLLPRNESGTDHQAKDQEAKAERTVLFLVFRRAVAARSIGR